MVILVVFLFFFFLPKRQPPISLSKEVGDKCSTAVSATKQHGESNLIRSPVTLIFKGCCYCTAYTSLYPHRVFSAWPTRVCQVKWAMLDYSLCQTDSLERHRLKYWCCHLFSPLTLFVFVFFFFFFKRTLASGRGNDTAICVSSAYLLDTGPQGRGCQSDWNGTTHLRTCQGAAERARTVETRYCASAFMGSKSNTSRAESL